MLRQVWIDDWQMQCCGDPFRLGDWVKFATTRVLANVGDHQRPPRFSSATQPDLESMRTMTFPPIEFALVQNRYRPRRVSVSITGSSHCMPSSEQALMALIRASSSEIGGRETRWINDDGKVSMLSYLKGFDVLGVRRCRFQHSIGLCHPVTISAG
jgi:hypothetical protein